jgi:hypothetical protein
MSCLNLPSSIYIINASSNQYAGLVHLYPTQNSFTTTLEDVVGSNDGTATQSDLWQSDSEMGGCIAFTGDSAKYIAVTDIGALTYPCEFEVWINSTVGEGIAWGRGNTGSGLPVIQLGLYLGQASAGIRDDSGASAFTDAGPLIDDGEWHLLRYVLRANNDRELFLDGVSVGTSTSVIGTTTLNTTTIGARRNTGVVISGTEFDGLIAHPRIRLGTVSTEAIGLQAFECATRWNLYSSFVSGLLKFSSDKIQFSSGLMVFTS